MFERLRVHGAELAEAAARRRRAELAEGLRGDAPAGVGIEEEDKAVILSGRGLVRRFALDPALRWLAAGRRR